jgi:hypothetical protein
MSVQRTNHNCYAPRRGGNGTTLQLGDTCGMYSPVSIAYEAIAKRHYTLGIEDPTLGLWHCYLYIVDIVPLKQCALEKQCAICAHRVRSLSRCLSSEPSRSAIPLNRESLGCEKLQSDSVHGCLRVLSFPVLQLVLVSVQTAFNSVQTNNALGHDKPSKSQCNVP